VFWRVAPLKPDSSLSGVLRPLCGLSPRLSLDTFGKEYSYSGKHCGRVTQPSALKIRTN
jgi:hypothetical protein